MQNKHTLEGASSIDTVVLQNVQVQQNGIIRNEKGYLIGRLVSDCDYNSEHVKGLAKHTPEPNEVERIARAISQSVRMYCGKGQYDTLHDCQDAYLDGVDTAIGMMYLDLTGTPKSKGILAHLIQDRDSSYGRGYKQGKFDAEMDSEQDRDAKARGEWYLGKKIQAFGGDYIVVGVSRMIYDEDCEGEPEWKITHDVQEVAIAKEMEGDSFQKPSWHKAIALSHNIDLSEPKK
jgi:hypothetical protein